MKFMNGRIIYSLLFYVLSVSLLIVSKPSFMFSKSGEIKSFGVGGTEQRTVFSFGVFIIVLAIFSFYVFALLDIIFSK